MKDQDNDEAIITEVLTGNREAFAVLVDKYKLGHSASQGILWYRRKINPLRPKSNTCVKKMHLK